MNARTNPKFLESAYGASVTNEIFKRLDENGFARATDVMSTQSPFCFEWSVKCTGSYLCAGIASELKRENEFIFNYDENAIILSVNIFNSNNKPVISRGNKTIHSNLTEHKYGDIIRFRFDPHAKKLLISVSVRISKPTARISTK